MAVLHVREFFQEFQELGKLFFIFAGYRYLVVPVIVKTVAVSLLDRFMFLFFCWRRSGLACSERR